jgi:hypothetical protein
MENFKGNQCKLVVISCNFQILTNFLSKYGLWFYFKLVHPTMHQLYRVPIILRYVQFLFELWFRFQVMVNGLGLSRVFVNCGLGH